MSRVEANEIVALLRNHLGGKRWSVQRTKGRSKESYVARSEGTAAFLKLDINLPPLLRLADLGVAPSVLGSGTFQGRPYAVQEYIDGRHPDRQWFADHLADVAAFAHRYHDDPILKNLLVVPGHSIDFTREAANVRAALAAARDRGFPIERVEKDCAELLATAKTLSPVSPVPVHADPNRKNFLITTNRFVVLDWDDVILSDPLRDTGTILWWYVPRSKWSEFFDAYGISADIGTYDRAYWWAAKTSLSVAVWLNEQGYQAEMADFLEDFGAAANKRENPHGGDVSERP